MKADYLIDTNVFVYAINKDAPFHKESYNIVNAGISGSVNLCTTTNNLLEFFAIVTDKRRIENPLSEESALEVVQILINSEIEIINIGTQDVIKSMGSSVKISKSSQFIFDLVIAAAMLNNEVQKIITYNKKDFKKIPNIKIILPNEIKI